MRMKKISNLLMMLLLMFSVSCVSLKPAKTFDKAEKKVIQFNKGIQNQIDRYPDLVDKAFTITIYDTLYISRDSAKIKLLLQNIDFLDSVNTKYKKNELETLALLDSLSLVQLNTDTGNTELDSVSNIYNKQIQYLSAKITNLVKENGELKSLFDEEVFTDLSGVYKDSVFTVNYLFKDGYINLDVSTNERYEVVEKQINKFDIKPKIHFWQDIKFYGMLLILLNALYFFGAEIQLALKALLRAIGKFIRKILVKV